MVTVIYGILFIAAVVSAILVVSLRNTVYCALSLVVTMLALAGIFLLIQAPFVALIQVLVYAGAIMVLFLFVIMLLNLRYAEPITDLVKARFGAAFALAMVFFILVVGWLVTVFAGLRESPPIKMVGLKTLTIAMLTDYLLPFELTSVLLLAAIIGAVLIAKRN